MNEQKVIVAILQHTLHRINEFLDEFPGVIARGLTPEEAATEFVRWQREKDKAL